MSRYTVTSEWVTDEHDRPAVVVNEYDETKDAVFEATYAIQSADLTDSRGGHVYRFGAYRVVRNGKPAKRGKGGTIPFMGESAWSDAARLFDDIVFAAQRKAWR